VKVVHLESGRHLYGGARQVQHLLAGLARHGVENVLVCRPGAEIARAATAARVIELPLHGDLDLASVPRLRAVLRRECADLLHVHSRAGADVFGGLAANAENVPALVTRRVDNREPSFWARSKLRRFRAIAAISSPIRAWMVEELGLPPRRIAQIASAVDGACFAPRASARSALEARFGFGSETLVIGAVGQLIARKGHDVLLAAMPAIVARAPRARLVIFGRGPAARRLRALITRHRLGGHVVLAGYDASLERMLAGIDLLVHAARAEGLGLAVLEAGICGVPIVASRVGGLVDVIEHDVTGVLVPPGDAGALADAALRLLADPRRRHALGSSARRRVGERHTVAAMTRAYLDVYGQLAQHAGRAH
jgi:glycosyltransferase involved in cell wall biosynthesis